MKTQEKIEALEKRFVFLCGEDYFDLSTLVLDVKEEFGLSDPYRARDVTVGIISDLLKAELVRPGFPNRKGDFEPWPLNPEQALDEISRE